MTDQIDNAIRVALDGNAMQATLRIAAGTDPVHVDAITIGCIASARGVRSSRALEQAIVDAVAEYDPDSERGFEYVIARGTPAKHGEDGRFELDADIVEILERAASLKRRRPADEAAMPEKERLEGDACHYDRSTITAVKPNDRIGRIVAPTSGEDGTDVCGGTAVARQGAPASIRVDDETIALSENGELTAIVGGLLNTADNHLRITEDLVIAGYVDFSTGNVEFDGDIVVERGVRDCFQVDAGGSITVHGQVEAAALRAGRDVKLLRGMTGREKGSITAGRDLHAKFIDSTEICVGRDLRIERELTHCTITAGRDIVAQSAALLGGTCTVAGSVELAQIGTESGTATVLRLGSLPSIDALIREAAGLYPKLQERRSQAQAQLKQLQANTAKLTATQAESMTELQFLAIDTEQKLTPLRESVARAMELVEAATAWSLVVHRKLLPGVHLILGGRSAVVKDEIPGPIRIELDERGEPTIVDLNSGSRTPLSSKARMDIDRSRLDFDDLRQQLGIAA